MSTTSPGFNRAAAVTRSLLGYGVIVGPIYLISGIVQGLVRDGFSFERHALSHLANGTGGWVQTATFALSGLMIIAAAIGFARALPPQSTKTSWFLGAFGVSLIAASIFRADPVDGFPIGTPEGMPAAVSTAGLLHFVSAAAGFLALTIACFVCSRAMMQRNQLAMARVCVLAGACVVAGFAGPMVLPGPAGIVAIWISVVAGWAWLAAMSVHLYRSSPDPNC